MQRLKRAFRRPVEIETSREMNALRNDSGAFVPLHSPSVQLIDDNCDFINNS
jgi:hypothetical protein